MTQRIGGPGRRSTRTRCARPRRPARSTARRSSRPSSPTRSRRSSRRRRWRTRAACASTASKFPDPRSTRTAARRSGSSKGSGHRPRGPEVPGGAEGLPRTRCRGLRRRRTPRRRAMKRAVGGAARGRGSWSRALVALGGGEAPRPRPRRRPRRDDRRRRAARPRRPREPRPARSATPTPARSAAGVAGHADRAARPGRGRHARALAVLGRRRAGGVPALRRAARVARLRARDDRRRGRPPARAQPARARLRPAATVDDDWDWATTAAVERFQDDAGSTRTARSTRGEVVFRAGADRGSARRRRAVGESVAPGRPVGRDLLDRARGRPSTLDARRQQLARAGDAVTVELPTGRDGARAHHRRRQGRRAKPAEEARPDDRGDDHAARRARGEPRPGAGRRRLRGRARARTCWRCR